MTDLFRGVRSIHHISTTACVLEIFARMQRITYTKISNEYQTLSETHKYISFSYGQDYDHRFIRLKDRFGYSEEEGNDARRNRNSMGVVERGRELVIRSHKFRRFARVSVDSRGKAGKPRSRPQLYGDDAPGSTSTGIRAPYPSLLTKRPLPLICSQRNDSDSDSHLTMFLLPSS